MFPPIRRFESENKVLRFTEEEAGQALFRTKKAEMDSGVLYWFIKRMQQGFRADEDDGCIVAEEENMGCIAGKCSFWMTRSFYPKPAPGVSIEMHVPFVEL